LEVLGPAGGEVVQHPHGVAVVGQGADQAGPNEAGATGDQDVHPRSVGCWGSATGTASRHSRPAPAVPLTKATPIMAPAATSDTWSEAYPAPALTAAKVQRARVERSRLPRLRPI